MKQCSTDYLIPLHGNVRYNKGVRETHKGLSLVGYERHSPILKQTVHMALELVHSALGVIYIV